MDLVAAVLQPGDALLPVTDQPRVHALTANPVPFGDLGHRNTDADFQHGAVSLLGHAQLPQHERECQASSEAKVSSIKRDSTALHGPPCTADQVSIFSTVSRARGARRARLGTTPGRAPRENDADPDAAQPPADHRAGLPGNVARLGAACRS